MAIDTKEKLFSMMNVVTGGAQFLNFPMFVADVSIDFGDKQHLLGFYSGIEFQAPAQIGELVGVASAVPTFIGVAASGPTFIAIQAGAEMTIFAGNDFDITVQDLRRSSDNSFENAASMTVKLLDIDDTVILTPVGLPADGNSTGGYRVTIPGSTFVAADEGKRVRVVIDGSAPGLNWDILETIGTRG